MTHLFAILGLTVTLALPAFAEEFSQVRDKDQFVSIVEGRDLRIGIYNLTLNLLPDGQIKGKALGWAITGVWDWQDGYFCRQMDWSGMEIPYNCQLVEARGASTLRFTEDKGEGDSASFRVR